jgi:proteasome lid subunit RPN8/RPN11
MVAEDLSAWTAEGHSIKIEYSNGVLEEIRVEAVKGITLLRHGGVEVGGVLFGSHAGDRIRIDGFRALRSEYAYGPNFILSRNDEVALENLLQEAKADPSLDGMEPIGWYHSHTRTGVFLSEKDIAVYNRYFPEPGQIVLILHPAQLGPTEAGFFFREADGGLRSESSYNSFTTNPPIKTPPIRVQEPDIETEALTLQPVPQTLKAQALTQLLAYPPKNPPKRPAKLKLSWLIASIVLGVLGVGVLAGAFHISGLTAGHRALDLRATDQSGQVHIEWDRTADPIVAARKASILIQDGDRKLETPLSEELLQHGSLTYQRKTGDVEIRLQVYGDEADPAQESTRLIGLPVVPAERLDAADRPEPSQPQPPPIVISAKSSAPAYRGPSKGRLIWTGQVPARGNVEIAGNRANTGEIVGNLPDVPFRIRAYPANFSHGALVAFVPALSGAKEVREAPSRINGWKETVYKRDVKRAGGVTVTQAPSARNHWRKIALRADRKVSAMVIDWEVLDHGR